MQEIVRDVPKEYKNIIVELVNTKQFNKIQEANALAKICVLSERFKIEEKVKINKKNHCANEKILSENTAVAKGRTTYKFMKEIEKMMEFSEMKCSF